MNPLFSRTLSTTTAAALVLAIAGPANAALSTGNLDLDVRSAVGSGGVVTVSREGSVVTLRGNVDDPMIRAAAARAAASGNGVDKVVNLIFPG